MALPITHLDGDDLALIKLYCAIESAENRGLTVQHEDEGYLVCLSPEGETYLIGVDEELDDLLDEVENPAVHYELVDAMLHARWAI